MVPTQAHKIIVMLLCIYSILLIVALFEFLIIDGSYWPPNTRKCFISVFSDFIWRTIHLRTNVFFFE